MIKIKLNPELFTVFFLSIFSTIITTIHLFAQFLQRPKDTIFIGLIHYWEDYFYYLDHFYQGAHGQWLTINNFTTEKFPASFLYLNNILIGKIGGLFGLESFTSYNLSVIFLKLIFIMLCYKVLTLLLPNQTKARLYAFLVFLFSSSLPLLNQTPTYVYRSSNLVFARFGNIPDTLMRNIIFILCFLIITDLFKKSLVAFKKINFVKLILLSFLLAWLTVSDPVKTLVFLTSSAIVVYLHKPRENPAPFFKTWSFSYLILIFPSIFAIANLFVTLRNNSIYQYANMWDVIQHIDQLNFFIDSPWQIFIAFGTLGIANMLGLPLYFRKHKNTAEELGLVMLLICLAGFILPLYKLYPVSGFRFLFPVIYIFSSAIAVNLLFWLKSKFKRVNEVILLILYLIPNLINVANSTLDNMRPLKNPNDRFAYLPQKINSGLKVLEQQRPLDANVLANPYTSMDILIPGITGKHTYSGHFLMNYNHREKDALADAFLYMRADQQQARDFLNKEKISYVVWTKYEGDVNHF